MGNPCRKRIADGVAIRLELIYSIRVQGEKVVGVFFSPCMDSSSYKRTARENVPF